MPTDFWLTTRKQSHLAASRVAGLSMSRKKHLKQCQGSLMNRSQNIAVPRL